jgi:hypothetical protein
MLADGNALAVQAMTAHSVTNHPANSLETSVDQHRPPTQKLPSAFNVRGDFLRVMSIPDPPASPRRTARRNSQSDAPSSPSLTAGDPLVTVLPKRGYPVVDRQTVPGFLHDIAKPINANRVAQCYVRREVRGPLAYSVFHLFGYDDTPIMLARNKSSAVSTQYRLIEPLSGVEVGWISSDWRRLNFRVKGADAFSVCYDENFLGRNGPRNFRVTLEDQAVYVLKPAICIRGEYYQDFRGLEVVPSAKNFVLVDGADPAKEVVLFGKTSEVLFEMRVSEPFSLFHAFALALTSMHTGLFHR